MSKTGRLTKTTAYILCNSSISLTDFEGNLMGHLLTKAIYIFMVKEKRETKMIIFSAI